MRTLIAAVVALAVVGAACSSSMSMDEYTLELGDRVGSFQTEQEVLGERHLAELDAAIADLQRSLEGEALIEAAVEETAQRSAQLFAAIGDTLNRFGEDLAGLDAPRSVSDEHGSYVDALASAREAVGSLLTDLTGATSFDQIDRAVSGSHYADSRLRVAAACSDLQEALADQSVNVDLQCESLP